MLEIPSITDQLLTDNFVAVSKSAPTSSSLKKGASLDHSLSDMTIDSFCRASEDSFVVHKGKNIPTLSTVATDEALAYRLEKERADKVAAGKPSNWDEKKTSYSGRRSRRNSVTDESQLTIENFGGSQDNLNFIGRNPDKESAVHVGRKLSAPSHPTPIENPAVRSSVKDNRSSINLGYDNGCEKENGSEAPPPAFELRRQQSSDAISIYSKNSDKENINYEPDSQFTKFADLAKSGQKSIQLVYMQQQDQNLDSAPLKSSFLNKTVNTNGSSDKKITTFATLPNTTTWQQQSSNNQHNLGSGGEVSPGNNVVTSQLTDIRLKLEEKRRHIESEKRRMEAIMNKQRQKVGKAAFLQAVTKVSTYTFLPTVKIVLLQVFAL